MSETLSEEAFKEWVNSYPTGLVFKALQKQASATKVSVLARIWEEGTSENAGEAMYSKEAARQWCYAVDDIISMNYEDYLSYDNAKSA